MKMQFVENTIYALSKKLGFFFMSILFTALLSCSNDDAEPDLTVEEKETAQFELVEDYYFDDSEDVAMEAFAGEQESGGKLSTDSRLAGASLLRTESFGSGTLRIDFDGTSADDRGNVRQGSIIIKHVGRWDQTGAEWTIQYIDYFINGIKVEGTRHGTVTAVTATIITHDVMLLSGKIIWPDGRSATREFHHRREYHRNSNHLLDRLIIYGNAQGMCRNGRGFIIEILEPMVFDRGCADEGVYIAVEGKKLIKHENRELTIDYGNGSCDNVVTLTNKAGLSTRYEVKK
jgi:hypothetical protein